MFEALRASPWPTIYGPFRSPVTSDVTLAGVAYCIIILLISLLIVAPGARKGQKVYCFIRVTMYVYVGGAIMVCNYGQEWEVASITTRTPYKSGLARHINATIRVKIGLRSINITLKGSPKVQQLRASQKETIDYNERFSWDNADWGQGVDGFGPRAGLFNQEYRSAQYKGVPYPILWAAEHFTIDGEGLRWGRFYRQAGYFTHLALWASLPLWLLAAILFSMVPSYGSVYSMLTGLDLLGACLLYSWVRNPHELHIYYEDGPLVFRWGWCFWLSLVTGIICLGFGLIIYIVNMRYPDDVVVFFGGDVTSEYDELFIFDQEASIQNYEKSRRQGRMTSLDNPARTSPWQLVMSRPVTTSLSTREDNLSTTGDSDWLEESLVIPDREEVSDGEEESDFDTVIADQRVYRQVFRKKPNSMMLLWKHTMGWRQKTTSPDTSIHPMTDPISVTHPGKADLRSPVMRSNQSLSPWTGSSPLPHPTIHRYSAQPAETYSLNSSISNLSHSKLYTDNDSDILSQDDSIMRPISEQGFDNAAFWQTDEDGMTPGRFSVTSDHYIEEKPVHSMKKIRKIRKLASVSAPILGKINPTDT